MFDSYAAVAVRIATGDCVQPGRAVQMGVPKKNGSSYMKYLSCIRGFFELGASIFCLSANSDAQERETIVLSGYH